jgi:hypothetical protein
VDLLAAPPPILSDRWFGQDLLAWLLYYVAGVFLLSLAMRIRLYWNVYSIARLVADSCPNVFRLLQRHLPMIIQNGIVSMLVAYGLIFLVYFIYARVVFPGCRLSIEDFTTMPGMLTLVLFLGGAVIAVDLALLVQVTAIDVPYVQKELRFAESWLGGRVTRILDILGKWNPIRIYADYQTRMALREFNVLFRTSMAVLIFQVCMRLALVFALFIAYAYHEGMTVGFIPR